MEYQFIVNPQTNRKCRVDSVQGKRIIKNYIQMGGYGKDKFEPIKINLDRHWMKEKARNFGTRAKGLLTNASQYEVEKNYAEVKPKRKVRERR